MKILKTLAPAALSLFTSLVFLDSLRFKFTNHPNTQEIFGRLDGWAATLGAPGLFSQTGLFSQYVIGSAELAASAFLLLGILPALRKLQVVGAAIGLAVMTGATNFHLWTPLGINVNEDGGALFFTAVGVWVSCLALLIIRRRDAADLAAGLVSAFRPLRD